MMSNEKEMELFERLLDSKFENVNLQFNQLNGTVESISETCNATFKQARETNGRVTALEKDHKYLKDQIWKIDQDVKEKIQPQADAQKSFMDRVKGASQTFLFIGFLIEMIIIGIQAWKG